MFEKTVLRRSEGGLALSAGQLAEALLFYQNVHLVIDRGTFASLLSTIGIGRLMSLLQRPGFTAVYCEEEVFVSTESVGAFRLYTPAATWSAAT